MSRFGEYALCHIRRCHALVKIWFVLSALSLPEWQWNNLKSTRKIDFATTYNKYNMQDMCYFFWVNWTMKYMARTNNIWHACLLNIDCFFAINMLTCLAKIDCAFQSLYHSGHVLDIWMFLSLWINHDLMINHEMWLLLLFMFCL